MGAKWKFDYLLKENPNEFRNPMRVYCSELPELHINPNELLNIWSESGRVQREHKHTRAYEEI